jgi:hypothetical protein
MLQRILITPLIAFILATGSLYAQETSLNLQNDHKVIIDGTSNARDWDGRVTSIDAEFLLNGFEGNSLEGLRPEHFKSLKLNMSAKSIVSDGRRLTNNIHDYLKADAHPVITFNLKEIKNIRANGNRADIEAEGVITAAGTSHTVLMNVKAEKGDNGSFIFSGEQPLKMTDFNITPPTAMLGAIRAADEMTIYYTVRFTK